MWMNIDSSDGSVDELGKCSDTRLCNLGGASGTVGGDGDVLVLLIGSLQIAQADRAVARAGTPNGDKAKALYGAGDEFAVEATTDENVKIAITKSPCAGKETSMPERIDEGGRCVIGGDSTGLGDVFVAQRDSEQTDDHVGQRWDDGQDEALLEGELV